MLEITAEYYTHIPGHRDSKFITFVNGYALAESAFRVAQKLAKENGQSHLCIKTYGEDLPKMEMVKI